MEDYGLVHIYSGDGKGKTTASVGLAVRAVGRGAKVLFIQFMKGKETGETEPLRRMGVSVIRPTKNEKFIFNMSKQELEEYSREQQTAMAFAERHSGEYDIIILDEIISAVNTSVVSLDSLIYFLDNRAEHTEIVLTGREPAAELVERADYISEIQGIKHPFNGGVSARKGIEF